MTDLKLSVKEQIPSADRPDVIKEIIMKIAAEEMVIQERLVRVCLRPRPRWLPNRVYLKLVKLLIRLEHQRT